MLDDSAPTDAAAYIGHADIPLLPLAHNKPISGTFRLMSVSTEPLGCQKQDRHVLFVGRSGK